MMRARGSVFNIETYLNEQKQRVDQHLNEFLPNAETPPKTLHEAMRYSVFAGGKRIRPILALATAEALGGEFRKIICLAGALEMIHTYSLIHDDLPAMDDDDYRRGQPTAHKKFGEGVAILAGTALLTLAFQRLAEIPADDDEVRTTIDVLQEISRAVGAGGMLAGQVMDLAAEGQSYSRDDLEKIHASKTGALIRASVSCAARISKAPVEALQKLAVFGARVGLAFQIVDDILDVEGSSEELGKTSGKDNLNDKATYPALYGLEDSRQMATRLIEGALQEIEFLGSQGEILRELARFISVRRF